MINLVKSMLIDFEGNTFFLILKTAEGFSMERMIHGATIKFEEDEDRESVTLTSTEFSSFAVIPLDEDIEVTHHTLEEGDKKAGTLCVFTIEYESGTELQVKIYENI